MVKTIIEPPTAVYTVIYLQFPCFNSFIFSASVTGCSSELNVSIVKNGFPYCCSNTSFAFVYATDNAIQLLSALGRERITAAISPMLGFGVKKTEHNPKGFTFPINLNSFIESVSSTCVNPFSFNFFPNSSTLPSIGIPSKNKCVELWACINNPTRTKLTNRKNFFIYSLLKSRFNYKRQPLLIQKNCMLLIFYPNTIILNILKSIFQIQYYYKSSIAASLIIALFILS